MLDQSVEYSDQEPDKEENAEAFGGDVEPVELEDGLQDDLCKLWDMSMNQVCGKLSFLKWFLYMPI